VTLAGPVIGVWGHFADANLGDDACPTALLHHLRERIPAARFVLFCRYPAIARENWGLPAYAVRPLSPGAAVPRRQGAQPPCPLPRWRTYARGIPLLAALVRAGRAVVAWGRAVPAELRFAWQSYRSLRGVDLLVITGSNPLFDFFGGFWGYPFRSWEWALLARLNGTRVAFVSVGAGPIVSARSGRLLARVLRRAAYVSFRDEGSRRLMREHGFEGPDHVCPDLAHSLPFNLHAGVNRGRLRVGINPMIVHNPEFWPVASADLHRRYVESLATLASALSAGGHDVFFYGTQTADQVSAREVQVAMRAASPSVQIPPFLMPASVGELFELCASADLLVTTRFHGAIFGIRAARPTLAICYQWKTREVLETAGQGAYAIDFEHVTPERLGAAFERLRAERHDVEAKLRHHVGDLRARLDRQYDQVARLVERDARRASFLPYQSRKPDVAGSLS